jgi:predicted RNase H-like nuclease (RuvC/YqgF family)
MRCIHESIIVAGLLLVSAASLSAQTAPPDSTKVTTLATVTVTAESGNWFTRADDLRRSVVALTTENRRLALELRRQDAQVDRLEVRLDSLKRVEAEQKRAISTIADSIAATRARRQALEARVIAAGIRSPQ